MVHGLRGGVGGCCLYLCFAAVVDCGDGRMILRSGSVTTTMTAAVGFGRENKGRFVGEVAAVLRIPSVSTAPEHVGDVRRAAQFVAAELKRIGMENVRLIETTTSEQVIADASGNARMVPARIGHPLVYAEWLKAEGKPTVL